MRVIEVGPRQRARFAARIAALEALASYPLGDDRFKIDHGPDYFAFTDRMGESHTWAALDGQRVVAVGSGVLRRVPFRQGARPRPAWYGCDLKVHPDYRGRHIPIRMLRGAFCPSYLRCSRGYGISMNTPGVPNRMARLVRHWPWTPISAPTTLELFSLDLDAMRAVAPLVARARGPLGYLSLGGVKDIVLESTGAPMPLLHVQWGPAAVGAEREPRADHVHMLCAPHDDPLAAALRAEGHAPSATATVIQHRMERADWRFVLTSEI